LIPGEIRARLPGKYDILKKEIDMSVFFKEVTMSDTHSIEFAQDRYERMTYRRSGRSGLRLPAISLGAWETFGGYRGEEIARACLYRAFDLGITHFDLANNYGRPPGNAERVVGTILRDMPRDELIISSKAGYYMWPGPYGEWLSKKYLVAGLDQSLKRLGLDYVDIFYAHRPDPETPLEETMAALDLIVKQGKALYVGVSNFPGAHFEEAVEVTKRMGLSPITIHQPRYNLLDRKPEHDLFDHTLRAGTGIITFSPLAQGLLSNKYLGSSIPQDSRAAAWWGRSNNSEVLSPETLKQIQSLNEIARQRGQTLAQMALAWNLRHPAVTSVLIGASKVEQIEENVAALQHLEFSEEELKAIDRIAPLFPTS
jgi:L-glyceraldehyde 3-phosphate reductase